MPSAAPAAATTIDPAPHSAIQRKAAHPLHTPP
jgi:hypothetical protein